MPGYSRALAILGSQSGVNEVDEVTQVSSSVILIFFNLSVAQTQKTPGP